QARFVIENGAIQLFFSGEVAKDHRLRHARGERDLLGGGAAKAALGKQAHRHAQNLQAAILAGHAGTVSVASGNFPFRLHHLPLGFSKKSKYSLTTGQAGLSSKPTATRNRL